MRERKELRTGGISFMEPVPGAEGSWYYGISREPGDLYEAEEIFLAGEKVKGNDLVLISYPEGILYRPLPRKEGTYSDTPVFFRESIYLLNVDFPGDLVRIVCFDCRSHESRLFRELPLSGIRNCYNLQLHTEPLTLTRQGDEDVFEILYPERTSFAMDPHESFFLREGERLYFSRWQEEGEGRDYRYWEETVVRSLTGEVLEILPGDVFPMPDGSLWHLF